MILSFPMKIELFEPNSDLDKVTYGCPFRFAFKYEFNSPDKFQHVSNEK